MELARRIRFRKGEDVLDLGCGTGFFALIAARSGARKAVAADVDPVAVACARRNARRNQVANLSAVAGDLFAPVRGRQFDVIIVNPPQTPAPRNFAVDKWGGRDGAKYFRRVFARARRHLHPGGRIYTMISSLAHTATILELFRKDFDVRPLGETRRPFTPEEYDRHAPGLFQYLERRRERGTSEFWRRGSKCFFVIRFFEGQLRPRAIDLDADPVNEDWLRR